MSIRISSRGALLAALFVSCSVAAQNPVPDTHRVMSLNLSSLDASGSYRLSADANENGESSSDDDLNFGSSTGAAIGGGIEDGNARFMLEYYYSEYDGDSPSLSDNIANHRTHALFYSGYWVPDIYWGLKGILGAGIGYAEQTLSNVPGGELSDSSWAYKFSAGLEYSLIKNLSLYALAENVNFNDIDDSAGAELADSEQTRVGLGVNFRF